MLVFFKLYNNLSSDISGKLEESNGDRRPPGNNLEDLLEFAWNFGKIFVNIEDILNISQLSCIVSI